MKRFLLIMFCIVFAFNTNSISAQKNNSLRVILDPGHGGEDSGAIGVNGIYEKDIVIQVAREVIRLHKELYNSRLEIYLTRYTDTLISLADRTKLVKSLQADVLISLHCNDSPIKESQGIEAYIQVSQSHRNLEFGRESERLAQTLLIDFQNSMGYKIRGIKYDDFQVLRETRLTCPGVLLELGFISNEEEAMHVSRRESITGFAMVILQVLIRKSIRMD